MASKLAPHAIGCSFLCCSARKMPKIRDLRYFIFVAHRSAKNQRFRGASGARLATGILRPEPTYPAKCRDWFETHLLDDWAIVHPENGRELLIRAEAGERQAIDELLRIHRDNITRMVRVRLHPKVRSRVDESDIVQEVFLDAGERVHEFFTECSLPFPNWLRYIAELKIKQCHRFHLDAQKRSAKNELRFVDENDSLSGIMACQIVSAGTQPGEAAERNEMMQRVTQVLDELNPVDREIICMRHFEQMENADVATALNIDPSTSSSRYLRALARLKVGLDKIPGVLID